MKKKTIKNLKYGGIGLAIIALLAVAGYFITQQTVFMIDKYGLTTDFTALLGISVPVSQITQECEAITNNYQERVCYINAIIKDTYGYIIFKGPASVETSTKIEC